MQIMSKFREFLKNNAVSNKDFVNAYNDTHERQITMQKASEMGTRGIKQYSAAQRAADALLFIGVECSPQELIG